VKNLFIFSFEKSQKYSLRWIQVVSFTIAFFISLAVLEILNHYFVIEKSQNFTTLNSFLDGKHQVEILFLGDSHFRRGIDVSQLRRKTFNLSFVGTNYIASYYVLKRYMDEMPNLKLVVLPLDPHSFSSFRTSDMAEDIFWDQFVDYRELSKMTNGRSLRKWVNLTLLSERFGRLNFIRNLRDLIFHKNFSFPPLGEERLALGEGLGDIEQKASLKVKQQFEGHEVFDEILLNYFEKILRFCKTRGIIIVTLQMPLSSEYLKWVKLYFSEDELRKKILQNPRFNSLIDKNLNYLTLYQTRDGLFSWGVTRDGDHLNKKGRELFSKIVSREVLDCLN